MNNPVFCPACGTYREVTAFYQLPSGRLYRECRPCVDRARRRHPNPQRRAVQRRLARGLPSVLSYVEAPPELRGLEFTLARLEQVIARTG